MSSGRAKVICFQIDSQEFLALAFSKDLFRRSANLLACLELPLIQASGQFLQRAFGFLDTSFTTAPIVLSFSGAPDPDQAKPVLTLLGAHGRCGVGIDPVCPIRTFDGENDPPSNSLVPELFPEIHILLSTPWQNGHELAAEGGEVREVLFGAELAVGYVDEVILGKEVPKAIEVASMDSVISPVPAEDTVGKRDRAIGCDVQPEHHLLEIRTMVLVVALGDSRLLLRSPVLPGEGDGRCIEMNPIRFQAEELDRPKRELEEDPPTSVFSKLVEGTSNAIVIDGEFLVLGQTERCGVYRFDPIAQPVERVAGHEDVVHEEVDGLAVAEFPLSVAVNVLVEDTRHAELIQEELNQRM
jgi:hypothetical protein